MNEQIGNKINDKTYIKLTPFKGFVLENFPFIEADFDAITNYQLLCKVIEYLNNVIANQNTVQELGTDLVNAYNSLVDAVNLAINEFETDVTTDINQFKTDVNEDFDEFTTNITTQFNNLQNYVNNYFDNNFPELVSDKLDEMATDGTLENLLNDSAHLTKSYNTYTDMINDSSTFTNGLRLKTLGYNAINDGGGANYYITNIEDNTIHHVDLQNGLFLNLVKQLKYNYMIFGSISNALTSAKTYKYKIFFPNLSIDSTINIDGNMDLEFSNITYTGSNYAIDFTNSLSSNIKINTIQASNGGGVNFSCSTDMVARNKIEIDYINCKEKCINIENVNNKGLFDNNIIGKVYTSSDNYCIYINSNASYNGQNNFNITRLESTTSYAIYISSLNGSFTGANFNYCSLEGSANGIYLEFTSSNSFEMLKGTFRVMEVTGTQLKLKGNMTYLTSDIFLTFDRIRYNLIDVSEVTWQTIATATVYINGHIVGSSGNNEISSKAMIKRNYVALIDFPEQFTTMNDSVGEWNASRPVTTYKVDPTLASDVRLVFRIPSWVCPENGRHVRIKLNGKNTTVKSPKNKWLHEYNTETGTVDIYAQVQGTTIQFNGYLDGVQSFSLFEQD